MKNQIVKGSISAISQETGKSIAESFIGADVVVLVDTSGSMESNDSRGYKRRFDVACEELAILQKNLPGKIAVLSFSETTTFCPGGVPYFEGAGTLLSDALKFAKVADVEGMRFIVISDGEPFFPDRCLKIAATYKNRIDVVYVGPEDCPAGRDFLERLAAASGGVTVTCDRVKELAEGVQTLLAATVQQKAIRL